jgi:transposase
LLHDNAPAHNAASVWPFLTHKNVTSLYHPLYSPDYFLFPKLKMKLKRLYFVYVAEIQAAVTYELQKVQKEEFLAAFPKLYDCTKACIYANGAYFEYKKRYVSSI